MDWVVPPDDPPSPPQADSMALHATTRVAVRVRMVACLMSFPVLLAAIARTSNARVACPKGSVDALDRAEGPELARQPKDSPRLQGDLARRRADVWGAGAPPDVPGPRRSAPRHPWPRSAAGVRHR